jgi:hypothetical protein
MSVCWVQYVCMLGAIGLSAGCNMSVCWVQYVCMLGAIGLYAGCNVSACWGQYICMGCGRVIVVLLILWMSVVCMCIHKHEVNRYLRSNVVNWISALNLASSSEGPRTEERGKQQVQGPG